MSLSVDVEIPEEPEFKWLTKRGRGGKKKEVQFYESFTYDGVDYTLYDCIFMHKQDEDPYIGKLVKMWENGDKSKKVKVHWFFRPSEISRYLGDMEVMGNELFFAAGDGAGLSNINSLDVVAGKCNVVCISKDSRNPQPSAEELQEAYVFYRVFDVKSYEISSHMGETVGGVPVQFVYNRDKGDKDEVKARKSPETSVQVEERLKSARKSDDLNNPPSKRAKFDDSFDVSKDKDTNVMRSSTIPKNDMEPLVTSGTLTNAKPMYLREKNSVPSRNDVEVANTSVFEGRSPKTEVVLPKEKLRFGQSKDSIGVEKDAKLDEDVKALEDMPSKTNALLSKEQSKSVRDTGHKKKSDVEVANTNVLEGRSPKTGVVLPKEKLRFGQSKDSVVVGKDAKLDEDVNVLEDRQSKTSALLSKEKSKPGHDVVNKKNSDGLRRHVKLTEDSHAKEAKVDDSIKLSDDKNTNTIQKLDKSGGTEAKNSAAAVTSKEDKTKSKLARNYSGLDKVSSMEYHNEKKIKLSNGNLSESPAAAFTSEDLKIGGHLFEVTRRPVTDKSKWFKELPWEERMQDAHNQGKLVLLQNLDPEYTSRDVEDIIWRAFEENCAAKMVQRTAISSPHSGQAFALFKTREAADRVVRKLDDGCLMLSNQRPLVGCPGVVPSLPGKQTSFVGHLAIDNVRRQVQRDMKDAVSTSHYSQTNTIEYEMAMDWCLLQSKTDIWWKKLYEQHGMALKKFASEVKSKK